MFKGIIDFNYGLNRRKKKIKSVQYNAFPKLSTAWCKKNKTPNANSTSVLNMFRNRDIVLVCIHSTSKLPSGAVAGVWLPSDKLC